MYRYLAEAMLLVYGLVYGRWATSVELVMVLQTMVPGHMYVASYFRHSVIAYQARIQSYDSCDVGTLQNQTYPGGDGPAAARNSGSRDYGGSLSYLAGQKLSACTCPGDEHPGPRNSVGRAAPEIVSLLGYSGG